MEARFTPIDINTWKRKEYFEFYSTFDQPFFGLDTEVECTHALDFCKREGTSFFIFYMHCAYKALNTIPEFKTRIVEGTPGKYDIIHVGTTIGRPDGSFGFCFCSICRRLQYI